MIALRVLKATVLATGLLAVTGCAAITSGVDEVVSVNTAPVHGAGCTLTNDEGSWTIASTPGTAMVRRSDADLAVVCEHPAGYAGVTTVASWTEAPVFGNFFVGGIIGASIDMGTGAAYRYPSLIDVRMTPKLPHVASAAGSWSASTPPGAGPVALRRSAPPPVPAEDRCFLLGRVEPIDRATCRTLGGQEVLERAR